MTQINQRPLSEPVAREIGQWLRSPSAKHYAEFLCAKAAELTAEAGNILALGTEEAVVDAKERADKAREYHTAIRMLREHSAIDYKFVTVEIKPDQPINLK